MGEAARQLETTGSNAANVWLPRPEDLPQPRDAANNVIPFPEAAEQKGRLWHEMLGARAEAAKYIQDLHDGKETEFQTYQAIEERFEELAREYAALEPGFDRAAFLNEHGGDWRELARSHRPGHEAAPSQKFQNLVELSDKMADEEQKADNLQAEIKAAAEKDAQVAGEERERAKREALDLMHALKLAKWVASHGETFEQRLGWPKEQLAQVVENLENGSVEPMDYIRGMHGCVGVIKEIKQSEKVEPGRREAEAARNTESPEELEAREKYESLKREYEEKKARLKPKDTYKRDKKTGASYYVLGELEQAMTRAGIAWNQLRNERLGIEPAVDKVLRERKEAAQLKENLRLADDALKQATDFGKTEDEAGEGQGEQKSEAKGLLDPLFEFKNSFVSVDRRKEMIEQARELAEERLQDEIDGYGTVEGLDGKRLGFFRKLWRRMKRDTYIEKYTALIAANPEDFLAPDDPAEAKAERDALVRQALEETKREYDLLESPEHRLETSTGVDGELKQLLMQALAGSISNEEYRARLDAYRDKNGDIDNIDEIYGEASAMLDSALATKVYDEATALAKIDLALDRIRVVQAEKLGERGEAKRAEVDRIANLLRKNRKPRMKEFEQPVAEAGAMLTAMAQEIDQLDAIENSPNALIHFDTRTSRARAMLLAMEARVSWVGNKPELIDNASDDDLDRKVLQLRGAIDRLSAKLAVVDAMAQMMRDYEERYQEAVAVGSTEPRRSPAEIYNVVKQNLNLTDQDIVNQFRGMFDAGVVSYRAGFIRRIHAAEQGERVNRARTSSGAEANKPKQYETPAPAVQPEEVVQTEESAPVEPEQPAVVTTEESTPVKPERPTADTKAVNPNTVKPNLPSQENRRTNFAAKNGFDPRAGRGQYFLPGANFAPAAPNNYYAQPAANYAPLQYTFNYVPYPMYTVYPQMMPQGFTPNVLPPPATPNAYQPNQFTPEQARELFQQLLPVFQPMIDELVQAAVSKALAERNNSAAESQPEPGQAEEASEAAAA